MGEEGLELEVESVGYLRVEFFSDVNNESRT